MNKWNKDNIRELILNNDVMVRKSLITLFEKQTEDEKQTEITKHTNNAGFNHADAKRMTGMAKFAIKAGFLTQKQIDWVRPRLLKYATQLARIANKL